jgi:hypothetical protein
MAIAITWNEYRAETNREADWQCLGPDTARSGWYWWLCDRLRKLFRIQIRPPRLPGTPTLHHG